MHRRVFFHVYLLNLFVCVKLHLEMENIIKKYLIIILVFLIFYKKNNPRWQLHSVSNSTFWLKPIV